MPVSTALSISTSSPKPLNRHFHMNDVRSNQRTAQQPQQQQTVHVALRVRPTEHASDIIATCGKVVTIAPLQKSFAFDHVFDGQSSQEQVFQSTASNLIGQVIDGRNTTLLTYGQSSTGKSYTLGSTVNNYDNPEYEDMLGIIPRAAAALFDRLQRPTQSLRPASTFTTSPSTTALRPPKPTASISASSRLRPVSMVGPPRRGSTPNLTSGNNSPRFTVRISFVQVHDDKLVDLLSSVDMRLDRQARAGKKDIQGPREIVVRNTGDVLRYLETGVQAKSSEQTHTVFTITVTRETWVKKPARLSLIPSKSMPSKSTSMLSSAKRRVSTLNVKAMVGQMEKQARSPSKEEEEGEWVAQHSKLHFVDLSAASIGMDDLLGGYSTPCSSPSSDKKEENCDTRLVRLLQGSTTMSLIACISAEDLDGTERTVKYASRARNNKVDADYHYCEEWMKNDNPSFLRETIAKLQAEVRTLRDEDEESSMVSSRQRHISSSSWSSANSDRVSVCPSSSARTTITIPDTNSEGDAQETLLADLRQQIEELQNEVAVTRERNRYVEKELKTARSQQFEKKATKQDKPAEVNTDDIPSQPSPSLQELKACLTRSIEREQAINAYIDAIEQKISALAIQDNQKGTSALEVIQQIKETFKKPNGEDIKNEADTMNQELLRNLKDTVQTKTEYVLQLETQLAEAEKLRQELVKLREDQSIQIEELTESISNAKSECTLLQEKIDEEESRSQTLQEQSSAAIQTLEVQLKDLTASNSRYVTEIQEMKNAAIQVKKHMSQQEQSTQKALRARLEELERVRADLRSLQIVEEKQNIVIGTLDLKLTKMDLLAQTLRQQLIEKESYIELLAKENKEKSKLLDDAQTAANDVLRDVNRMGDERKQLNLTIQFLENALRRQDNTLTKCTDQLQETARRCNVQGMDLDEKQRCIEELTSEKQDLERQLETMTSQAWESDGRARKLQAELSTVQTSLQEQISNVSRLEEEQMHTDIELQRTKALEGRVMELDEELARLQSERNRENTPNNQLDEVDIRGIITGLESRLKALQQAQRNDQDEFDIRFERAVAELEETQKTNKDQQRTIEALESSLKKMQVQLDEANATYVVKCKEVKELQEQLGQEVGSEVSSLGSGDLLSRFDDEIPKRASTPVHDIAGDHDQLLAHYREKLRDPKGQEEILQKLTRLAADNAQLATHVTDLEGQISLQRSKMTLETKNLELEVIRLTSAKNRLEKEMEQVMSRAKRGSLLPNNRDSTSSVTSPPQTPRVMSPTRDSRLPKSVSLRSLPEEDSGSKRISQRSNRSRTGSNSILPPPSAPPSNPLPPVPTALPPLPSATSPPLSPTRSVSSPLLHRQNSNTTASASEITIDDGLTSERYEKIILSMQRKMRSAENDVRAHQDVISKLESQLSRSEHMVREVKKQLDVLSREKQASSIEIQNLRSQVTQARNQQQSVVTRTAEEYKMLEEELAKQRRLKEKAEKARLILENRMEELMSKKNKFMCF
ncbi:hypothetical protein BJV82DRAFT_604456 [Fennellomyces sp. T-0311]|nr:hypothetical protein BJV82DRAFT_604456 [Fennellomyces sp. T-0311]